MSIKIALNAHLLSAQASYRSAGIHGYIYQTLAHLPVLQPDWRYHILVGDGQPPQHPALTIHRAAFKTRRPAQRILWEQLIQPLELRKIAPQLYHGMAFVIPFGLNMPSLVTVYDLSFMRFPKTLGLARRLYLSFLTRASCRRATRVIAISQSTASDVHSLLKIPQEKISVALPGVGSDFKPLPQDQVEAFRVAKGLPPRFILHLGTLEPRKNLVMLLHAYAALPKSLSQRVGLVLAGGKGWDYEPIFEAIESLNLSQHVHLAGYVPQEDLPLWYNAAELFAYPSLFEGWGLPITEAMACGTPTIVSQSSSLPEAAGETGLCLPPNDIQAWRDGLEQALTDSAWQANSRQQGIHRAAQFTWQQTAQQTLQAYHDALATNIGSKKRRLS